MSRRLPAVFLLTAVLLALALAMFRGSLQGEQEREDKQKIALAVVQEGESSRALSLALSAFAAADETRFSLTLTEMSEESSRAATLRGEIAGYFVFPEGFLSDAVAGDIRPIRAVFPREAGDLVLMVERELTSSAADMFAAAQRAAYGGARAASELGGSGGEMLDTLVLRFVNTILRRGEMVDVRQIGASGDGAAGAGGLLLSALLVVLFFLPLPLAGLYPREDPSLGGALSAAGVGRSARVACRFLALTAFLLVLLVLLLAAVLPLSAGTPLGDALALLTGDVSPAALLARAAMALLPAVALIAALSLLLFSLAREGTSGALLHFFTSLALLYLSGCFLPLSSFPPALQPLCRLLPPATLRAEMAAALAGRPSAPALVLISAMTLAALAATTLVQRRR